MSLPLGSSEELYSGTADHMTSGLAWAACFRDVRTLLDETQSDRKASPALQQPIVCRPEHGRQALG